MLVLVHDKTNSIPILYTQYYMIIMIKGYLVTFCKLYWNMITK